MRIKYNFKAFEHIRRLPAIEQDINNRAEKIAAHAGNGYQASPYAGKTRHRASVITTTYKAKRDNAKNNTLIRSLHAGQ